MNKNIELEIDRSLLKIENLGKQSSEISLKIDNLNRQLHLIKKSLEEEEKRIATLGLKQSRKDGKPETEQEIKKKEVYNSKLQESKKQFIEGRNVPESVKESSIKNLTSPRPNKLNLF